MQADPILSWMRSVEELHKNRERDTLNEQKVALHQLAEDLRRRELAVEKREEAVAKREAAVEKLIDIAQKDLNYYRGRVTTESATNAVDHGRQEDPMDDVAALVQQYQSTGGVVPLGVIVAEVEAVQQAATRLKVTASSYRNQIGELEKRLTTVELKPEWINTTNARLEALKEMEQNVLDIERELNLSYGQLRDNGVERFAPLLNQTVNKYDAVFEGLLDEDGEAALDDLRAMVNKGPQKKGNDLRQPLPSARPKESLDTLMLLFDMALQTYPKLFKLAEDLDAAIGGGCSVVRPPKPIKGVSRILQKTQEEYASDYTRLLDYVRVTVVCDTLPKLVAAVAWLLSADRLPRFEALRTKDRLTRHWDPEMSGGNRDVMINGWLHIGGRRRFIVEIQVHLEALYALKSDLHVLYNGARVLGAMEDATVRHEGIISDDILRRVERSVIRKLDVPCTSMTNTQRDRLITLLKKEPCTLLHINLDRGTCGASGCFTDKTLFDVLAPSTGTLACRKLRHLNFACCGLVGAIPLELLQIKELVNLILFGNNISGTVPDWLGGLYKLEAFDVGHNNNLSGDLPESFFNFQRLKRLRIDQTNLGMPEALERAFGSFVIRDTPKHEEIPP